MASLPVRSSRIDTLVVRRFSLPVETRRAVEFVDVTPLVEELVARAGVREGLLSVRTRHTTTGIVVNENEPLLLRDLTDLLERWAPRGRRYRHDDFDRRRGHLGPGERVNGHAHAGAVLLGASESVAIAEGRLELGRWQSLLFVDLDGPQDRTLDVTVLGSTCGEPAESASPRPARRSGRIAS